MPVVATDDIAAGLATTVLRAAFDLGINLPRLVVAPLVVLVSNAALHHLKRIGQAARVVAGVARPASTSQIGRIFRRIEFGLVLLKVCVDGVLVLTQSAHLMATATWLAVVVFDRR